MADVGPVGLEEVRDVLRDRLVMLDWEPPPRRYGRVFIGTPHQARGRTFKIAFVPGLAQQRVELETCAIGVAFPACVQEYASDHEGPPALRPLDQEARTYDLVPPVSE